MTQKNYKILFGAYRDWAIQAYAASWAQLSPPHDCVVIQSPEQLEKEAIAVKWDMIILIGWSWKVPSHVLKSSTVIGMHPSDLPAFAGGSPIQNQILAGIEQTKASLFKLTDEFDAGAVIDKEDIDLRGHLDEVLRSISSATTKMVLRFVENFPNNVYLPQTGERHVVRRLKPHHSRLSNPVIPGTNVAMTCKEMWNHIRCREDPYPNAYFEDETGRLVIKHVEFEPKQ